MIYSLLIVCIAWFNCYLGVVSGAGLAWYKSMIFQLAFHQEQIELRRLLDHINIGPQLLLL